MRYNQNKGELPVGWTLSQLGELVAINSNQINPASRPNASFNYVAMENIEKGTGRLINFTPTLGNKIGSSKNVFEAGDILYGKLRPYLRKTIKTHFDGICVTDLIPLRPHPEINSDFIKYFLLSPYHMEYIGLLMAGIRMPRIRTEDLFKMPVPTPPASEQRRIVTKLEKLFGRVDASRKQLQQVPDLLKQFRQSVMAAACSGRLTADWRTEAKISETAGQLVGRIEASRKNAVRLRTRVERKVELPKLPNTWGWISNYRLASDENNSICAGPFGTIFKAKDFRSEGIPIIFLRHIGEGNFLSHKRCFMDRTVWNQLHKEYSIYGGELLVTKLGDPPGTACIYPEDLGVAMVTPDVIKMHVDERVAETKYLMFYFNSMLCKSIISELAFGVTRLRIDLPMFRSFPIPLPPREEQKEIVLRVEAFLKIADSVENHYRMAQEQLEKLPAAILAKAFRGELVSQNTDDEPAWALLERIRADRPVQSAADRKSHKRRVAGAKRRSTHSGADKAS